MAQLRIERVNSLPATLQPSTLYYVKSPEANLVDLYVTGSDANELRHIINKSDVQALISAAMSAFPSIIIAQDIAERDALSLTRSVMVLVLNAAADETVSNGSAMYVWDQAGASWYKIAEYESLDLALTWDNIVGKPNSSAVDIDNAVGLAHTHANMAVLVKMGELPNGRLSYNNFPVGNPVDSSEW
jgi:hypothetical protein